MKNSIEELFEKAVKTVVEKVKLLNKKQKIICGVIVLVILSSFVSKLTGSGEKYKDKPVTANTTVERATAQTSKDNDSLPVIKGTNAKYLADYYNEKYPGNLAITRHFDFGTKVISAGYGKNGIIIECSAEENKLLAVIFLGQDTKSFLEDFEDLVTKMLEGSDFGSGTIQGLVDWCKNNKGSNKTTTYNGLHIESEIKDDNYTVLIGCEKYAEWIDKNHPNFEEDFGTDIQIIFANFEKEAESEATTEEPATEEPTTEEPTTKEPTTKETTTKETTTKKSDTVTPSFKETMDAYEAFFDEYVSFMKKYMANPTDMGLLTDYLSFMSKYTEYMDKIDDMDQDEMSDADLAYYLEVTARIEAKLLGVVF